VSGSRPDPDQVLSRLKDFQRDSADYAFRRLYRDPDTTRRFLVADEAGLGKTLVAGGIVAMAVDHLWDTTGRIDVLYICSNADIARQNLRRLNVVDQVTAPPDRITLLPRHVRKLQGNKVNLIPLTPGTSFALRSSEGRWEERVLLYWMIREAWSLGDRASAKNLFQGWIADTGWFRERLRAAPGEYQIDEALLDKFAHSLHLRVESDRAEGRPDLLTRFNQVADKFGRARRHVPAADRALRAGMIGELRYILAVSCLEALKPDLIILDEFQRFKDLLKPDEPSGALARGLFEYQHEASSARVLLLSATPYKMYTMAHDVGEDHYRDFVDTLCFLTDGNTAGLEGLLRDYRDELLRVNADSGSVAKARDALETGLRRVMIRTERLAGTDDRDGMLVEVPSHGQLMPSDLRAYLSIQRLARWLEEPDATEYWKSSPYLMSFMESYKLKVQTRRWLADPEWTAQAQELLGGAGLGLPWQRVASYDGVDPANPRAADGVCRHDRQQGLAAVVDPAVAALLRARWRVRRSGAARPDQAPGVRILDCRAEDAHVHAVVRGRATDDPHAGHVPGQHARGAAGSPPSASLRLLTGTANRDARAGHAVPEPGPCPTRRSAETRRAGRRHGVTGRDRGAGSGCHRRGAPADNVGRADPRP
jgi:hypothetical protein